jgi:sugar lactone lactonase YvrE/enterochelin esterase-like enzyme
MLQFDLVSRSYYPGSKTTIYVYVPAEYVPAKPACLYVGLDGAAFNVTNVLDNLIYKKQVPVTIGVFVPAGSINAAGDQPIRYNRCFEYDSVNDRFDRYLLDEVLPLVEKQKTSDGRAIRISPDPNDHMVAGLSSGGVCAFTAAWQHPDMFRRVFTAIGTYVGMRGADMYPTLVRKTEPKPIRIYLQDGEADTWNPLFDNWYTQNRSMEESLRFAGYDVNHTWGLNGHEGSHADSLFPDVMRWMWRDYPQPVQPGVSGNSMLQSILLRGEDWHPVEARAVASPKALAVDPHGSAYFTDGATGIIYKCGLDKVLGVYAKTGAAVAAEAFGPDGTLFASQPGLRRIVAIAPDGKLSVRVTGLAAGKLTVLRDGIIYATEPALHDDMPSTVWRIDTSGHKKLVDSGLRFATGILVTADHSLLFAAEGHTHWIYSYQIAPDGMLINKQRYYWLHVAESASDGEVDWSDASDLAGDASGNLYVATRMGVQICDRNGRVEAILPFTDGSVTSLAFGDSQFNLLFVVAGNRIYVRRMQAHGVPGFGDTVTLPGYGAG